jgi:hypothetical protein
LKNDALPIDLDVRVVTARDAALDRGPIGVTDRFSIDGKVVGFVTLSGTIKQAGWTEQSFESRWYSGDRLVRKSSTRVEITKVPFSFWSDVEAAALGTGAARYELHVDGRKIAEHPFMVVDPSKQIDPKPARKDSI